MSLKGIHQAALLAWRGWAGSSTPPGRFLKPLGAACSGARAASFSWGPPVGRSWPLRQQLLVLPPGLGTHLHLAVPRLSPITLLADCAGAERFLHPHPPSPGKTKPDVPTAKVLTNQGGDGHVQFLEEQGQSVFLGGQEGTKGSQSSPDGASGARL